ncbi:MAG: hypothetical protein IT209_02220 [Armatimonadetes bacterium]|nr:hypothetical protein [Armatimonadota bacterium]
MTFRERTLRTFQHKPVDCIVYQPRIEHWYNYNKARNTLPERYRDMDLLEVYDDLNCSIRPYHYYSQCRARENPPDLDIEVQRDADIETVLQHTPVGTLKSVIKHTDLAQHQIENPIKTHKDVDVMEYILRNSKIWFDMEKFKEIDEMVGDRAAPMVFYERVNMQRILLDYVGWQETVYLLADDRELIERLVKIIDETDEGTMEALLNSPIPIINFGDNLDEYLLSPRLFEEFVLPVYQDRGERFRKAGQFTQSHFDGNVKHLLKYCQRCGIDGFEALTPKPQGDLTIDEMKEALGDNLILLDGIPMTAFLPSTPEEEFERVTREIIETFSPNLVLGISDEPSPVCDIERVRRVGEILREYETSVTAQ